ncbi:MAG: type II secretion system protein M [Deltaproteobacteria bacterium]|nr:type II secretion system protein M [Deltaproteobacteria bacterium]
MIELPILNQARQAFARLQPRERKLVAGAGVVLVLLLAWTIVVQSARGMDRLEQEIANGGKRLEKMQALIGEYRAKKQLLTDVLPGARGGDNTSLQQRVQEIANQAGAQDAVATIRTRPVPPGDAEFRESAVEIQLKNLAQEPMVKLLVGIDRAPQRLKVSRLRVDTHGDEGKRLFDLSVTISRFEPVASASAGERS